MEKNSTYVLIPQNCKKTEKMPSKSTLDFLKQFARAYSYNKQMPANLGGFIAN